MEFKPFREEHLDACTQAFVAIFNAEPWNDEWTFATAKQYISDFYHSPRFVGVLAVEADQVVGFIYGTVRSWWSGNECYINEMGVREEYRNQGIGKALLKELVTALDGQQVENFALLTDRGMPAEVFYQKNGFKAIERLVFYSKDL